MDKPSLLGRHRDDSGNSAVEFALVLPVLVFMALGAMDFGMAYSTQTGYESAARAGLEYAFKNSSDLAGVKARITANIHDSSGLDSGYPAVTEQCECADATPVACSATCTGGAAPYRYVAIDIQGSYQTLYDWPFLAPSLPIQYTARMRVE